jgi:DNA-binding MarR family transcriptional regulator
MNCEDQVFGEHKLTTERFGVLVLVKLADSPVRPTDLARWLGRSTNGVSMIVDRMVKAGLLRRVRDKSDRRAVHVSITSKGENALKPATVAGLKMIRKILSPLSYEDRHTFAKLLEMTKYQALQYLNPGIDIEEVGRNDIANYPDLANRLFQYISTSTSGAKPQGAEKRKTI